MIRYLPIHCQMKKIRFKNTFATGVKSMKKVTSIVIGAGLRGGHIYSQYALDHPDEFGGGSCRAG